MADAEFNVISSNPCENTPRRRDGAHIINIHHLMGSGIKRTRLAMGNANPYEAAMPDLAAELQERISAEYKFIESAEQVKLESFIGASIVRVCVRDEHEDVRRNVAGRVSPRAELVAALAFVHDPNNKVEVELHKTAQQRIISENGIGSVRWAGGSLPKTLFLPMPPTERSYAVEYAVPALPYQGRSSDPHIALHSIPESDEFVEELVSLDQLRR